jgi:hypothetical protein
MRARDPRHFRGVRLKLTGQPFQAADNFSFLFLRYRIER